MSDVVVLLATLRAMHVGVVLNVNKALSAADLQAAVQGTGYQAGLRDCIEVVEKWAEQRTNPREKLPAGQRRAQVARRKSATRRR